MATVPYPRSAPVPAESATGPGVFRPSAAFPLPRLRPVADFVALPSTGRYVTVHTKFVLALGAAGLWLVLALAGAWRAVPAMSDTVAWPVVVVLYVLGVAAPGAALAFMLAGLLLDQPPTPAVARPALPVTVAITSQNQPRSVVETLESLQAQDYDGPLTLLLVDNGSGDATLDEARRAVMRLGIALRVVVERRVGLAHVRNTAAACADTPLVVMVRAGSFLHPSAVRLLVARLLRSPSDTAAVSAHALVRNRRDGDVAEQTALDYAVSAHAHQRVHGLFQAPLVAEGTCMLYRADAIRAVGGWTRNDDDSVMITWRFLERGWRVFHESLAVVFTSESVTAGTWASRRVRAANAIVEGARAKGLGSLRFPFSRFVAVLDATGPLGDGLFTGSALLALALAVMGAPALVVAYALLVLPLSIVFAVMIRRVTRDALDDVGMHLPARSATSAAGAALSLHVVRAPLGAASALARVFGRME